jgi:hypothetical protein
MTDNWQPIGKFASRVVDRLQPEVFSVTLQGPLADAVMREAVKSGIKPETFIAEAVRSYMGDAA